MVKGKNVDRGLTIDTMLLFFPSLSINFSARIIMDRSLRTRFKLFSSFEDFFSLDDENEDEDFSEDVDFSRYSMANECDLLIRFIRAGSCVKAGAIKLEASSLNLTLSGFTSDSEQSPPPVPSTIGNSSRYKSHFPCGLSLPT